ncbi:hypothetical protein Efla_007209 [Eimeria flavescens]
MKRELADESPGQGDDYNWDDDALLECCLDLMKERGIMPGAFDVAPEEEAVLGITTSLHPRQTRSSEARVTAPADRYGSTGAHRDTRGYSGLEGSVGPSPSGSEESAESSHPVKKPTKQLRFETEGEGEWLPNSPFFFPSAPSLYAADESLEGEFLSNLISQQPDTFGAETGSAAPEGQMLSTAGVSAGAVERYAAEAAATQVEPGFLVVKMHSGSVIRIRHPPLPTPPDTHPFYRLPQLLPGEIRFRIR